MSYITSTPKSRKLHSPVSPRSLERWSSVDQTDESSLYPLSEESTPGDETEDDARGVRASELTFGQDPDEATREDGLHARFADSDQDRTVDGSLPNELDVGSLIAAIEHTPTAWGANFWVVLSDPVTACTFYACPATGDCSWDPPVGAMVLPRRLEGEYWELKDERRGGRSYYYHTGTGKTQWTRPKDELVIPLGMIQMNALRGSNRSLQDETEREGSTKSGSTVHRKDDGRQRSGSERTVDRPSPGPKHRTLLTSSKPILKLMTTTPSQQRPGRQVAQTRLSSTDPFVSYERRTGASPILVTPFGGDSPPLQRLPLSSSSNVFETQRQSGGGGEESPSSALRVKFYKQSNHSSTPNLVASALTSSSTSRLRTTSKFNLPSWGTSSKTSPEMRSDTSFMFSGRPAQSQTDGSETEKENAMGSRGKGGKSRKRRESSVKTLWMAKERQSTAPVMTLSDVIRHGGGDLGKSMYRDAVILTSDHIKTRRTSRSTGQVRNTQIC